MTRHNVTLWQYKWKLSYWNWFFRWFIVACQMLLISNGVVLSGFLRKMPSARKLRLFGMVRKPKCENGCRVYCVPWFTELGVGAMCPRPAERDRGKKCAGTRRSANKAISCNVTYYRYERCGDFGWGNLLKAHPFNAMSWQVWQEKGHWHFLTLALHIFGKSINFFVDIIKFLKLSINN